MEVVVVEEEEGEHWSLGVPPTMHHGRQGVTRAPPLALVWPATAHSLSAPFAPPRCF